MTNLWTGILAEVLSPFYYHGLYVPSGGATDATILTDTAVIFALAHTFGIPPTRLPRSTPDYAADLARIPWRATLFQAPNGYNPTLPPVRHIVDVDREGGNQVSMQRNMASGNFKKFWWVHEVAPSAQYVGALWGPNPFEWAGNPEIIIRVGVGRMGLVRLKATTVPDQVVLNGATTALWGYSVPEDYRILDTIRVSYPLSLKEATTIWMASLNP